MMPVVALYGDLVPRVVDRLGQWSAMGLVGPLVCLYDEGGTLVCRSIDGGAAEVVPLEQALLGRAGSAELVGVALPDADGHIGAGFFDLVDRSREALARVLAAKVVEQPPLIVVPAEGTTLEGVPAQMAARPVVVVVPEDESYPGDANVLGTDEMRFCAHAAHAVVVLTGLVTGSAPATAPLMALCRPESTTRQAVWLLRCFSRSVDVGYLCDQVAAQALRPGAEGWPNPDLQRFDRTTIPDVVKEQLVSDFFAAHEEVFGLTATIDLSPPKERRLSLWEAIKAIFRFFLDELRRRPIEIVNQKVGEIYNRAAERLEQIAPRSGVKVRRWGEKGNQSLDRFAHHGLVELPLVIADGAVGPAWRDLRDLTVGLLDGSNLPDSIRDAALVVGERRQLEQAPEALLPDPSALPPGVSMREGPACDPRRFDALAAKQKGGGRRAGQEAAAHAPDQGDSAAGLDDVGPEPDRSAAGDGGKDEPSPLEVWLSSRVTSVMWKVGRRIVANIEKAEKEARPPDDDEWKGLEELIDKGEEESAKQQRRRKWLMRLWTVAVVLGIAGAVAARPGPLVLGGSIVGLLGLWWVVVVWLWLRSRPGRRHKRSKVEALEQRVVDATYDLINRTMRSVIRRADLTRLERRYQEYLNWAEAIGHFVYRPVTGGLPWSEEVGEPIDVGSLPEAWHIGVGEELLDRLSVLVPRCQRRIFHSGWLLGHMEKVVGAVADEWSEKNMATAGDVFSDITEDVSGLRTQFMIAARSGRFRTLRESSMGQQLLESLEDERVDVAVTLVGDRTTSRAEPLPPAADWFARPARLNEVAGTVEGAVVRLRFTGGDAGGSGTGVVVDGSGLIATCWAAADEMEKVEVQFADGTQLDARVFRSVPNSDLVILKVESTVALASADLSRSVDPRSGEQVFTIGFPPFVPAGARPSTTWGLLLDAGELATDTDGSERTFLRVRYPDGGGVSGSPLFDLSGALVGIHTGIASMWSGKKVGSQLASLARPLRDIAGLLEHDGAPSAPVAPVTGDAVPGVPLDAFWGPILRDDPGQLIGAYGATATTAERVVHAPVRSVGQWSVGEGQAWGGVKFGQAAAELAFGSFLRITAFRVDVTGDVDWDDLKWLERARSAVAPSDGGSAGDAPGVAQAAPGPTGFAGTRLDEV